MTKSEPAEAPHPRETHAWFGHAEAERTLVDAYRSGRMAHAWLLGGPHGIGKATLAYRMARFVLAHADPANPAVQTAGSLEISPDSPTFRKIAAQSHGDLLVLERRANASGTLRTVISVDEMRRTVGFFGSTAGEGGWRVCIVDAADEMQAPAANALLKVLEEPPTRALFLIVSHAPGRLLATIRSRCRCLMLRSLAVADVAAAVATAAGLPVDHSAVREAAAAARGSVALALTCLGGEALAIRAEVSELLGQLPRLEAERLHALGDSLGRAGDPAFHTFIDTLQDWLSAKLAAGTDQPLRLARVAEVWEKLDCAARDVEVFNLERKPMVFAAFGMLAEMARLG